MSDKACLGREIQPGQLHLSHYTSKPPVHSYGSGGRSPTFGSSSSSSSSDPEHPATSPQKKSGHASTCAPSSSAAQVVSIAQSGDEGFIQLDDRLLQEQPSYMQKPQVHELRNLMPDGYQLTYWATWKSIIPLHAGTSIGIHYHSIKDLGEFSIHPFKVLFLETYGIMPGQLAPNGHRLLGSFINVCRFLRIPLSLRLFDYMFDVRPGSKETLGFVVVSSHQGRAFLCGLPPSNKKWKDKYVCVKFPPGAFPFAQNVWGKRMKRQVKPAEADDLVAWEATLRAGDASTRGLYHVGKWSVYPGRETDPEPEIVLPGVIPEAIPIRQARGSKAPATTNAGPSRPAKKKKEKGRPDRGGVLRPACWKEGQAARAKAEKIEAKWTEHCAVYRQLYAKHDGLLKAAKEADEQAQAKINQLEAKNARSAEEIARLGDELQKEQSVRAALAAAWATQAPEEFAAKALPDWETAIRFFQGLYKYEVSAGIVDEIGTYGFESGQYSERKALYGILQQRIQGFQPKALSLPELHSEAPEPPFPGI
ncbi:unnamed protein product [Cuscuta campestris]|uniref:Transposase (putative) gypsy type domain-containing protein n=1 Tax=Cuscuta campestris TaxID=132261 RepID=A0A484NI46_9ASTE|nr:unnamed protein product [Cuscuta campestris]